MIISLLLALADPAPAPPPAAGGGSFASYISDAEYPLEAIRRGEQGLVEFTIDVSSEGGVAGCTVTRSSGSEVLDATTCRLLSARARFRPAHGPDGHPIASRVSGHIRWVLPR